MIRYSFILLSLILSAFIGSTQTLQKNLALIPMPVECNMASGNFTISNATQIFISNPIFEKEIVYFQNYLKSNYQISPLWVKKAPIKSGSYIELRFGAFRDTVEGQYKLTISKNKISIEASEGVGVFYALQSLIQLLPVNGKVSLAVPCLAIEDFPRYKWRGMHLDCSRHFFSTAFVKKYIEMMASYKMNVFHWHLTDDQGWRIEIKHYPMLTEVGAWRKGSMVGPYADQKFDSIPYGGFYTQEEIKDIVDYANMLHVTIVPEIEMPGHALAALAAYPEYSCSGEPCEVGMKWGVETNVFCPAEHTFTFLDDILGEVASLFPGKYIHIGGDEVLKDEWEKSPLCQQIMQNNGFKNYNELQSFFIKRIEYIVRIKGKSIIGWDEILDGGLAPNAAVMSWRGIEGGIAAAKQNHDVVMTPGAFCYFDHYQADPKTEPLAIGGFTTLEKVYSYEPTPDSLSVEEAKHIMGAQGNVWTEYMYNSDQVEYMAMPRMAALAEIVWVPKEKKNYQNFYQRMELHRKLLDKKGIKYAKSAFGK